MILFVSADVLMIAVGAVLYLMVRALPRVAEEPSDRQGLLDRWAHSELPEKFDAVLDAFMLKFLRKLKIFTLRIDNAIAKHLHKLNANAMEEKIAFSDFVSGRTEDAQLEEVRVR